MKKRKKWLLELGGSIKKGNIRVTIAIILGCFIIGFFNLFDQIAKGQSLLGRIGFTAPFPVIAYLAYLFRKNLKYTAFLLAAVSIVIFIDIGEPSELTGLVFLMPSLAIFQTYKSNAVILSCIAIAIGSKTLGDFTGMQAMVTCVGAGIGLYLYYEILHPKKYKVIDSGKFTKRQHTIIKLLANGLKNNQIAKKIDVSEATITRNINEVLLIMSCKTIPQLMLELKDKGYIMK